MKLEINGQIVEVDDSFANLPPDQQQSIVSNIAAQMSKGPAAQPSQPGFVSQAADKLGMSAQDPLLWGGVGTVGGLALGPMVTEGARAAMQGAAGMPSPGAVDPRAPGQKWAAKTGFGEGTGETVREVSEEFKKRREPIGQGKVSENIPKNKPLTIADYQAQKAREEMEARMRAKNAPMTQKLPPAAQTAVRAAEGAASRFPAWMARGAAGASTGFQAADALNRLREGDVGGGIVSGLGALGSVLSFIPHPLTRIGGTALAAGAPLLLGAMDSKDEEKQETGGVNNPMADGGPVGYNKGRAVRAMLPPAANAARTQIPGTLPTYQKAADIFAQRGAMGRGLDYGAGLGKGAQAMPGQYETYEPFARGWSPTYSEASEIPSDAYNRLTNLNVLNVVPREARDEIVKDIGRVMEPGGLGIITTRGGDVMKAMGRPGPEPTSIITSRDTYQKGFTPAELQEYLKYMLGEGYDIERLGLGPAGAMIRKKAEGGPAHLAGGGLGGITKFAKGFKNIEEPLEASITTKNNVPLQLKRNFIGKYDAFDESGNKIGSLGYRPDNFGGYVVSGVHVVPEARRQGVASAMYDFIENEVLKQPFSQSGGQSEAGKLFREFRENKKAEGGLAYMAGGGHATPAWQRKEGQNPEGGLNAKGRASYKRETGGTLKRPQPEGGPRKKSFCARMTGMKKKLTSAKTANDPDSRINKSLRAWNC